MGIARGNGTSTSYGYDSVSRLTSLAQDLGGSTYDFTHAFAYNPASQIASVTRSNDNYAWGGHANVNRGYTVNGLNQATAAGSTSIGHDGRGNVTSLGSAGYTYTADNQLATAPGGDYAYDPLGRLFHETAPNSALLHDGTEMVMERDATSGAIRRRYVYGPGVDEPLVWYEGSGTSDRRWLHADERGSVVAITNGSGTPTNLNSYDEHGVPGSGNAGRFQYTGQAWLPALGMYYYKARVYNPVLGRFMQTDPIGYNAGMNLYNYVSGDPINRIDPTGMDDEEAECWVDINGGIGGEPALGQQKVACPTIVVTGQREEQRRVQPSLSGRDMPMGGDFGYGSGSGGYGPGSAASATLAQQTAPQDKKPPKKNEERKPRNTVICRSAISLGFGLTGGKSLEVGGRAAGALVDRYFYLRQSVIGARLGAKVGRFGGWVGLGVGLVAGAIVGTIVGDQVEENCFVDP